LQVAGLPPPHREEPSQATGVHWPEIGGHALEGKGLLLGIFDDGFLPLNISLERLIYESLRLDYVCIDDPLEILMTSFLIFIICSLCLYGVVIPLVKCY